MMFSTLGQLLSRWLLLLPLVMLGACATGPNPVDPYESWNRKVATFNERVDSVVLQPAAIAYRQAVPPLARTGVNNFFNNFNDVWSTANNVFQLRLVNAAESWMRVSVNTVFGLGGLLDIATELGIERHREDFGKTLGRWGVPTGPYMVLPLLGPSTVRDTVGMPVDYMLDPLSAIDPASAETAFAVLRVIDARSNLLRASSVLDQAALDKYSFTRDAYLQRRESQIYRGRRAQEDESDGDIPPEEGR
ncbi:VacJ family lipoprotein [Ramlibacter sp. AW1]|uniref:VacJ family lipoprotein n=1 Tax=Ramlibacter aurantiacus TaxID=2801330 RepID=A0A937D531_9BURK|nr:VacJ family lipoprotein [Ramlibacter aurantiacus]MBL0422315.1 VacJ family lipoprotein [Ramlibacter aurantiacus]